MEILKWNKKEKNLPQQQYTFTSAEQSTPNILFKACKLENKWDQDGKTERERKSGGFFSIVLNCIRRPNKKALYIPILHPFTQSAQQSSWAHYYIF